MDKVINSHNWPNKILNKFEAESGKSEIQITNYNGLEILIYPEVFSPLVFPSTRICVDNLPRIVGKRSFLEIGSGCGINTLAVVLNSGDSNFKFLATDINPHAVANTNANLEKHGLPQKCIQSDVFESVDKDSQFEVIFWNHPFNDVVIECEVVSDVFLKSGFDHGYQAIRKFFRDGKNHLVPGGSLLLCTSRNVGNWRVIKQIAKANNFVQDPKILAEQVIEEMDLCIVEFTL